MRAVMPPSKDALLVRANALTGRTLGELAQSLGVALPAEPRRAKGFIGQLVEQALGATAGSRGVADFEHLGIELKTIPLGPDGTPRESTFVTTLDLSSAEARAFATSRLRAKLTCVLFVPVDAARGLPLAERRLGVPVLWQPTREEEALLREDFEGLVELHLEDLGHRATAHQGQVLQLRPKGATARALQWSADADGVPIRTSPRAFYLRARFTAQLLARARV
jgi:DNA mismatch repair protein MutH